MKLGELCKVLEFSQHGDDRGQLVAIEGNIDIPFEIKRMFYIYGSSNKVIRGKHANRRSKFVLINVSGISKIKVSTGKEEYDFVLDCPYKGLYLDSMVWKEMYGFSEDSVLLVLASEHYDSEEYIRDYNEFLEEAGKQDV